MCINQFFININLWNLGFLGMIQSIILEDGLCILFAKCCTQISSCFCSLSGSISLSVLSILILLLASGLVRQLTDPPLTPSGNTRETPLSKLIILVLNFFVCLKSPKVLLTNTNPTTPMSCG